MLTVTSKNGYSGLSQWNKLSRQEKDNYKEENKEIRSNRVQKVATYKNGTEIKDLWEEPWVNRFKEAGKVEDFKDAQREVCKEIYWNSALTICRDYNICTDRGIGIVLDRTVNQGAGGCRSLVKKIFKIKTDRTVEEELSLLKEIKNNWRETHFIYDRVDKILKTSDFNNQQYVF